MPDHWKQREQVQPIRQLISPILLHTLEHTQNTSNPLVSPDRERRRHSPEPMVRERPDIRVMLVGTGGVGKTSYLRALLGKSLDNQMGYIASSKTESIRLDVQHTKVELVEMPGQYHLQVEELLKEYPQPVDGFIVMYDMTNLTSMKKAITLYEKLEKWFPLIPKILVANKSDQFISQSKFPSDDIVYISTAKQYNVHQPLQRMLQKIRR